jgi:hypothetical protein
LAQLLLHELLQRPIDGGAHHRSASPRPARQPKQEMACGNDPLPARRKRQVFLRRMRGVASVYPAVRDHAIEHVALPFFERSESFVWIEALRIVR